MEFYQRLLLTLIPMSAILVLIIVIVIQYTKGKKSKYSTVESEEKDISKDKNNGRDLRIPFFYRIVALVSTVVFTCGGGAVLIFDFDEWPLSIIFFGFFCIPFLIMFICWSLWKVEIYKDGFLYRNFIGKKSEYKYGDLEHRVHPKGLKWYFYKDGKKVFCMPYYVENENLLEKAYKKWKNKNKKN